MRSRAAKWGFAMAYNYLWWASLIILSTLLLGCGKESATKFSEVAILMKGDDGKVEGIEVARKVLSADALAEISNYQDVTTVILQDCKQVNDKLLVDVASLKSLEDLQLLNVAFTDAGLAHLKDHPTLQQMVVVNTKITGTGLAELANTPLVRLDIRGPELTSQGMASIAKLAHLESLELFAQNVEVAELGDLSSMNSLKSWVSNFTPSGNGVGKVIASLPNLQAVFLNNDGLSDEDVKIITSIKSLTELNFSGSQITNDDMVAIGKMKGLKILSIVNCKNVTAAGLAHLSELKELVHIDLTESAVDGSGLKYLIPLASLKSLELTASQIKDRSTLRDFARARPDCRIRMAD
jgi:Leucine-rich repeat (LRR) protein